MAKTELNLVGNFMQSLAGNGQVVFLVKSTKISDQLAKGTITKNTNFEFWSLNEIKVVDMSFQNEGYVKVNREFDVPLARLTPAEAGEPIYMYEKEAAILKITQLNQSEYDLISAEKSEIEAQEAFLRELIENRRY